MSPPRKILMTTDAIGGVWTYALDLAAGLAPFGVETTLAVLGPSPARDQVREAEMVAGLTLIETGLPLDWIAEEPAAIGETAAAVRGLARERKADLVHLNSPALAAGGFPVPVLGVCHSCLATWWSEVKDGPMPPDFVWRTQALWRGLLACDALAAPTASFAAATARAYEVPTPFVVQNGRRSGARPNTLREPLVFTSGRLWDEGKNVRVLDQAAGLIASPAYAAGPLASPSGGELDLAHLTALGRLSAAEIDNWLSRASIYASSALYEPFGLGVLEAAQAGCALVLSDIPTFRELWDGAALLVDPADPRAYAAAFDRLLRDEAQARRLGALAKTRARRFTVEAMTRGVLDIYAHLAGALAPPRRWEAVA